MLCREQLRLERVNTMDKNRITFVTMNTIYLLTFLYFCAYKEVNEHTSHLKGSCHQYVVKQYERRCCRPLRGYTFFEEPHVIA